MAVASAKEKRQSNRSWSQPINHHKQTMEAPSPSQDLTPTLARSRISPLVPQPPPSPGTPGTPSTPVARPVRSGKARDLLRQHYGMNIGPPAPIPGRPHDPMNIGLCPLFSVFRFPIYIYIHCHFDYWTDSASFDAKAYYEQLITTTSLTGLLKRENELSTGLSPLLCSCHIVSLSDFFTYSRNTSTRW